MQRGVANKSRTIRIPVHIVEREQKIARAERDLVTQLGRTPTEEEIAEKAKLPLKQVREVRKAARAVTSLDKPVGEDATPYGDLSPQASRRRSRRRSRSASRGDAPPRGRDAARARAADHHAALRARRGGADVARGDRPPLGLTRERVRQIEAQALSRLAVQREIAALSPAA